MSAIGRMRARVSRASRPACIGRRIISTEPVASTNETAFAMKAASRPNAPATTPPSAAPMASIAPHSEPKSTLAFASSSGERTRFGSDAWAAGPTNEPSAEIAHRHTYPIQSVASESTRSRPMAATACTLDTVAITTCRLNRSAAGPETGVIRNAGRVWAT